MLIPTNSLSVQSVTVYLCLLKFLMRASHSCVTFSDPNERKIQILCSDLRFVPVGYDEYGLIIYPLVE